GRRLAVAAEGRRAHRPAGPPDRGPDAARRGGAGDPRRPGEVPPRDGRRAGRPAEARGDDVAAPDGDDDRAARGARQGLTRPGVRGPEVSPRRGRQPRSSTTRPCFTTVRTRSAAGQYGIWREVGTFQITRSACLPRSREPISSASPRASAALIVTAE